MINRKSKSSLGPTENAGATVCQAKMAIGERLRQVWAFFSVLIFLGTFCIKAKSTARPARTKDKVR